MKLRRVNNGAHTEGSGSQFIGPDFPSTTLSREARTLGIIATTIIAWLIIHGIVNFLLLFQVSKKYKL
jgi:hypothetical protein